MTELIVLLPVNEQYRSVFENIWPRTRFRSYAEWIPSPYKLFARVVNIPDDFSVVNSYLSVDPKLLKGNYQLATAVNTRVESNGAFISQDPVRLEKGEKKALTKAINEFMELENQKWIDVGSDTWLVSIRDGKPLSLMPLEEVVGRNFREAIKEDVNCTRVMTELQMWLEDSMITYNRKQGDRIYPNWIWFWGRGETIPSAEIKANKMIISDIQYQSGIAMRLKWDHMSLLQYMNEETSLGGYDQVVIDLGNYYEYVHDITLYRDLLLIIKKLFNQKIFKKIEFLTLMDKSVVKPFSWWPFSK